MSSRDEPRLTDAIDADSFERTSEFDRSVPVEVLKDVRVGGRELEATRIGVRNDQAVEWVARPRQIVRLVEPRGGGGLVDCPSVVVRELSRGDLKVYPTELCEKLDLE